MKELNIVRIVRIRGRRKVGGKRITVIVVKARRRRRQEEM